MSPEQAIAHHFAAALRLEDAGRLEEALARYDEVLKVAPSLEDAVHNRGLLLVRLGRLDDAETNARRWLASHPGSPRARGALADVLLATGRYPEAIQNLDAILAASPYDISALVRRGIGAAAQRDYEQAAASFSRARAVSPGETASYVRRVTGSDDVDAVLSPQNIFLWQRYVAQGSCDWAGWDEYVADFRRAARAPALLEPALAFAAFHLPLNGRERHAIARDIAGNEVIDLVDAGKRADRLLGKVSIWMDQELLRQFDDRTVGASDMLAGAALHAQARDHLDNDVNLIGQQRIEIDKTVRR